jgi:hypothetical protein
VDAGVILSVSEGSGGMGGTQQNLDIPIFCDQKVFLLRATHAPRFFAHAQNDAAFLCSVAVSTLSNGSG